MEKRPLWSCNSELTFLALWQHPLWVEEPYGHHHDCSGLTLSEGAVKPKSLLGRRRDDTLLCNDWDMSGHRCRKTEKLGTGNLFSVLLKKSNYCIFVDQNSYKCQPLCFYTSIPLLPAAITWTWTWTWTRTRTKSESPPLDDKISQLCHGAFMEKL